MKYTGLAHIGLTLCGFLFSNAAQAQTTVLKPYIVDSRIEDLVDYNTWQEILAMHTLNGVACTLKVVSEISDTARVYQSNLVEGDTVTHWIDNLLVTEEMASKFNLPPEVINITKPYEVNSLASCSVGADALPLNTFDDKVLNYDHIFESVLQAAGEWSLSDNYMLTTPVWEASGNTDGDPRDHLSKLNNAIVQHADDTHGIDLERDDQVYTLFLTEDWFWHPIAWVEDYTLINNAVYSYRNLGSSNPELFNTPTIDAILANQIVIGERLDLPLTPENPPVSATTYGGAELFIHSDGTVSLFSDPFEGANSIAASSKIIAVNHTQNGVVYLMDGPLLTDEQFLGIFDDEAFMYITSEERF
jgi:hypothetical protein